MNVYFSFDHRSHIPIWIRRVTGQFLDRTICLYSCIEFIPDSFSYIYDPHDVDGKQTLYGTHLSYFVLYYKIYNKFGIESD